MKTVAFAAALLIASPVLAQTPTASQTTAPQTTAPQATSRPTTDLTRMLNGASPTTGATSRPATVAQTPAASTTPPATPQATRPTPTTPAPSTARPATAVPATTAAQTPRSATATPTPSSTPASPRTTPAPVATTSAPATVAAPPPAPAPTVLNAAAITALPFTVTLPVGFRITTGRPGPDFTVYAIRRGDQPFVMVYVGPASQFPIYSGQQIEAAGRTSIVVDQDGRRKAVEHLFRRESPARDIHVWISSLEGADERIAEQIAQSVDDK